MTDTNVDTLKDVTKMLIDSRRGYAEAADNVDEDFMFQQEFQERADQRQLLINKFQQRTEELGHKAETDGKASGVLHRLAMDFTSMFGDDRKKALNAIDDGEERLAEHIESKLEDKNLNAETKMLLQEAHRAATQGERFAERMSDA